MRILITGCCGFVGSTLARCFLETVEGIEIFGIDNFIRPGSESNRESLKQLGVRLSYGDIRCQADLEILPKVDWVIDAAANPSVLAGVDGRTSSRQLIEHNLLGTVNMLEFCKSHGAGFILLSTSRVYSIEPLARLPVVVKADAFVPDTNSVCPPALTLEGITESFPTASPVSLYGATKLASEQLACEYGSTFDFPVWINRCGVLAGAGQFGRPDQGIFAYWINSWLRKRPLKFIGFGGKGHQVRDCLHPRDIVPLLVKQFGGSGSAPIFNVAGGTGHAMSLKQLSDWCAARFGEHPVSAEPEQRRFDIPWMVLDASLAKETWNWRPEISLSQILTEIADHAEKNPHWLSLSSPI